MPGPDAEAEAEEVPDGFDFEALPPPAKPPPKTPKSAKSKETPPPPTECGSAAHGQGQKRKFCDIEECEETVQGKQKRCGIHRRAVDILKTAAYATAPSDGSESEEMIAFSQIFGSKNQEGDPALAKQVLQQFLVANPDLKQAVNGPIGRHTTKKRVANVSLAQFIHRRGFEHSLEEEERRPKVDLEIFQSKTKLLRGWDATKSLSEWRSLETDPSIMRDNKGPPYAPLRLRIPEWIFSESASVDRVRGFESKELNTSTKARQMSEEEKTAVLSELDKGFTRPTHNLPASSHMLRQNLPVGAITEEVGREEAIGAAGMDMMKNMVGVQAAATGRSEGSGGSTGALGGSAKKPVDVVSVRNTAYLNAKADITKVNDRLQSQIHAASLVLEQGCLGDENNLLEVAIERWTAAMLYLGSVPAMKKSSDGKEVIDFVGVGSNIMSLEDVKAAVESPVSLVGEHRPDEALPTERTLARKHTKMLQHKLKSMTLLPVENIEGFLSSTEVLEKAQAIRSAMSVDLVESLKFDIDANRESVEQLLNSLKTAVKDLARENRQVSQAKKKAERDRQAREASEVNKKKEEDELIAKKKLMVTKKSQHFVFDWSSAGHPCIPQFAGDIVFGKANEEKSYQAPFILTSSEKLTSAFGDHTKVSKSLSHFSNQYPSQPAAKQFDRLMAPLKEVHGAKELTTVWQHLVPEAMSVSEGLPSLVDAIACPWLYGTLPSVLVHGYECDTEGFLGCMRIQVAGETDLLAAPLTDLAKLLTPKEPGGPVFT